MSKKFDRNNLVKDIFFICVYIILVAKKTADTYVRPFFYRIKRASASCCHYALFRDGRLLRR